MKEYEHSFFLVSSVSYSLYDIGHTDIGNISFIMTFYYDHKRWRMKIFVHPGFKATEQFANNALKIFKVISYDSYDNCVVLSQINKLYLHVERLSIDQLQQFLVQQ